MNAHDRFAVFFAAWIVLAISGVLFYYVYDNVEVKRKAHPWLMCFLAALFVFFVLWISEQTAVLVLVIPAAGLITFLNIRNTKFCRKCGAVLYNHNWFTQMNYCSRCG